MCKRRDQLLNISASSLPSLLATAMAATESPTQFRVVTSISMGRLMARIRGRVAAGDAESYKNNETVDNSKSLKKAVIVYDLGLSDAQTKKLMDDLGVNKTV